MARTTFFLYLVALLFAGALAQPPISCNCVAFRLDDIQDYFCGYAQRAVMDIFKEYSYPLTFGVIAAFFGNDVNNLMYLLNAVNNKTWGLEVANHGWIHEDFTTFNLDQQLNYFNQSQSLIARLLNKKPVTFIPPYNRMNADTVTAMQTYGLDIATASVALDPPPYDLVHPNYWRFPTLATTSIEQDWTYYYPDTADNVFSAIQNQLNTFGFSAVMMHPQEFSAWTGTTYDSTTLNQTAIAMLRDLLNRVKASGIKVVTFSTMRDSFAPPPTSAQPSITATSSNNAATKTGTVSLPVRTSSQASTSQVSGTNGRSVVPSEPVQTSSPPQQSGCVTATVEALMFLLFLFVTL